MPPQLDSLLECAAESAEQVTQKKHTFSKYASMFNMVSDRVVYMALILASVSGCA